MTQVGVGATVVAVLGVLVGGAVTASVITWPDAEEHQRSPQPVQPDNFPISSNNGFFGSRRDPNKQIYAVHYSPGPNWDHSKSPDDQITLDHRMYLGVHMKFNLVLVAGPFLDSTGAEAIIQVASEDEAIEFVEKDPAVEAGLMKAELKPWNVTFDVAPGAVAVGEPVYQR